MKFSTGFWLGVVCGTGYALFTTKRTGADRQQAIAHYVDDVTGATQSVQQSVRRLGNAVTDLQRELKDTLAPNVKDITDAVTDFEFQTQAHTDALSEHLETISAAADQMAADAPIDPAN
ncbi:YtxH domain-containing protein [Lacticaseibacillus daqingensis]|uniref:YtxH domain-containing protein n=1 Tax=Lacticaseibacillus daqingensis TaxID=2486014 RepID=UPI000F7A1927|nr:YtxH domain-containing protein [Lacticaseibacillus daqingensis]